MARDHTIVQLLNEGTSPRISAVVCTYRRADTLRAAIESLMSQSLPKSLYEIIVVDNDAKGSASPLVQALAGSSSPALSYVIEPNQGLSHARNRAVREAAGDIVAFLDDDAVASPDWLAVILSAYDADPTVGAVGGKVLPIWDRERPPWLTNGRLRSLSLLDLGEAGRALQWPERIIGANCSFQKGLFEEVGLFATDLGRRGNLLLGNEDTEIQMRIHSLGRKIVYAPEAAVAHHVPGDRLNKRYFYRRAYGSGMSEAIVMNAANGSLFRKCLSLGIRLPARVALLILRLQDEQKAMSTIERIAHELGFLRQSGQLLLRKAKMSTAPASVFRGE